MYEMGEHFCPPNPKGVVQGDAQHTLVGSPIEGVQWELNPRPLNHQVNVLTTRTNIRTASQVASGSPHDCGLSHSSPSIRKISPQSRNNNINNN